MKGQILTEKNLRDVRAFFAFAKGQEITEETVIAYKARLTEACAPRSIIPCRQA